VDDNTFAADLDRMVENSFNIHRDGNRLVFREAENPQARLLAEARNDRLFADGSDYAELARHARYVLAGSEDLSRDFVAVVLGPKWVEEPWSGPVQVVPPEQWKDRLPLVVLPEAPAALGPQLGPWLKAHLATGRNTVRFLFPKPSMGNLYRDRELLVAARAVLRATEWMEHNSAYRPLQKKYRKQLEDTLKERFGQFAVLDRWSFQNPERSQFNVESLNAQGVAIPPAVEQAIRDNLFEAEAFQELVLLLAQAQAPVSRLLSDLREPRPNEDRCLPWLGEIQVKERLLRLCSKGTVALNLRGVETLQRAAGEPEADAWQRMKGRLPGGRQLEEVLILPPLPQGSSGTVGLPGEQASSTAGHNGGSGVVHETSTAPVPPGGLFGGGPAPAVPARRNLEAPANSSLNLLGYLETSRVGPGAKVHRAEVRVEGITGSQLQELLRKLPDGMRYRLSLEVDPTP